MSESQIQTAEATLQKMREEKERISDMIADAKEKIRYLAIKMPDEDRDVQYGKIAPPEFSARSNLHFVQLQYNKLVLDDYDLTRRIMKQMDRIKRLKLRPGE